MTFREYGVLFAKYVGAGIVGYPIELAGIYLITEYLHVWYLLSAAVSLGFAFVLYFALDVLAGVVRVNRSTVSGSAEPAHDSE